MLLIARVRRTLLVRGLVPRGSTVVVGTSGGPDSTALLDALARLAHELDLRLVAAGIDHGLRTDAAAELDLAEANAGRAGVPFERVRVTLEEGSLHAAARAGRYRALHEIAARHGAAYVAVGHTLDDQAETAIARVLRGSGLRGLGAIDPARSDGVVRPLIDARRSEVRAYLADTGLRFAEDPSNVDRRFERTRVRHEILPTLLGEDPEAALHLALLADEAREVDSLLEALGAALLADAARDDGIDVAVLRAAPRVVALRALRRALGPEIGRPHLTTLASWLQNPPEASEIRLARGRTAQIARDRIVVFPLGRTDSDEEA